MGQNLILFLSIFTLSTTGNVLMKMGAHHTYDRLIGPFSWMSIMGLMFFAGSSVMYAKALQTLPLYFAYSMLAAQYLLIMIAAWFFLGETITVGKWVGCAFIMLGLFCMNRF